MVEPALAKAEEKMKGAVEALKRELASVRTGRASPALVEHVKIDYGGVPTPLNHLAGISVSGTNLLVIQPWDPSSLHLIEKGILKANLSLTPASDGRVIRLSIPPLSEERRQELVRLVKKIAEEQKVIVRNIRRDANEDFKKLEKDKDISQDDLKRGEAKLQKLTDVYVSHLDQVAAAKETELKQV
ncbi:MAG: ribosome recycling factor [Dehalococcoidia bacterium]|nr:ribosome recycling factor [Dehalococcoidia bacterium]